MSDKSIYILVSIFVLAVIVVLYFTIIKNKKGTALSPMAGLAFGLILAGFFWGENRWVGYGFMGAGVTLAMVDAIKKMQKKN